MMTLYFLRHGQTAFSRENMFCGSGTDADLTEEGRNMANAFSAFYRDTSWEAIFVSPLRRTRETIQPLAALLGEEIHLRDELKEISYGQWEGKTVEEVELAYGDDYWRWSSDPVRFPPTGGETAAEVAERGMRFVEDIRRTFTSGNILAVSHKATIRLIICSLLGIDLTKYRILLDCPVSSLSVIEFRTAGPMLKLLGDRSHLDAQLRDLPGT